MLALAAAACGSAQPDRNASAPTSTSTSDSASAASASATPTPSVATVETSGPAPTSSAGAPTPPLTVESAVASLGLLPGLSRSGAVVACIDEARGDSCGTPVLRLIEVSSDATTTRIPLLENCGPPIPERVEDAKKVLASEPWSPFDPLVMEDDPTRPPASTWKRRPLQRAVDPRTLITFHEPVLTISIDGKAVLKKSFPAWSDSTPGSFANTPCRKTSPVLERVWIEQSARIALVGIGYVGGNDVCPGPQPSLHTVRF